ncbi:hypothetical protein PybrP1_007871 [[Pythium] brassicae (nom. inval.)]|nr:hypothetical protein PybrP1_007871 [[Pythium] brassicae (nom. inval.)]
MDDTTLPACELARQSTCSHPTLFTSEYKRCVRSVDDEPHQGHKGACVLTNGSAWCNCRSGWLTATSAVACGSCAQILRCFPHCCPAHVGRSYCGSALFARVTHAHDGMLVFAHFEEADANFLCVGDEIAASRIASSIQTEQTPKGEWIEGCAHSTDEATSAMNMASFCVCYCDQDTNARLFEINPSARWYYEWGSAATKAQRFTKHVLRVYVLERSAYYKQEPRQSSTAAVAPAMLRVVAVATSSTFMVVSYRRAADETRTDRRLLALLASNAKIPAALLHSASMDSDSDSPMRSFDSTSVLLQHARFAADGAENEERERQHHASPPALHDDEIHIASSRDRAALMWQEKKLWESANPGTLMQTKHLAILFCVLAHAEAARFAPFLEQWSERFASDWNQEQEAEQYPNQQRYHPYASSATSVTGTSTVGSPRRVALIQQIQQIQQHDGSGSRSGVSWVAFLSGLESSAQQPASVGSSNTEDEAWQQASQLSALIQICADVAGWLVFSADNVGRFRRLFTDCVPLLLDKDALRGKFVECVQLVCTLTDHFLSTSRAAKPHQSAYASTQALVEELIAAVFKFDALQTIRPAVLTILSSTSMLGLAGFVAQARSHFLRESGSSPSSTSGSSGAMGAVVDARFNGMALTRVLHSVVSPFRGSWRFEGAQSVAEPSHLSRGHVVSVINALDWMRECSAVEVDAEEGQQLVIRSLWSISDGDVNAFPGMTLIADGRARVFSHFPSGLSSMIPLGARYYGDYEANFLAPDLFELVIYSWSDVESEQTVDERESGVPKWGSDEKASQPGVLRWRLQLALERFGRPTAAPGTPVLCVDITVDVGLFRDTDSAMERDSLHERLREIAGWESVQRLRATYRRADE